MINTLRKTLEAQEKTQDIKQSPSMKIGTKPYTRSRRNELTVVTGCRTGRWASGSADRRLDPRPDAGGNRPDVGQQRPIDYSKVPEQQICDRTRPVAGDWTLASVRSVYCRLNGRDDRTRPVRAIQRPVSSRIAGVQPQRLLSQWGL